MFVASVFAAMPPRASSLPVPLRFVAAREGFSGGASLSGPTTSSSSASTTRSRTPRRPTLRQERVQGHGRVELHPAGQNAEIERQPTLTSPQSLTSSQGGPSPRPPAVCGEGAGGLSVAIAPKLPASHPSSSRFSLTSLLTQGSWGSSNPSPTHSVDSLPHSPPSSLPPQASPELDAKLAAIVAGSR